MGGRVDFANGTLEDKKKGARNIAEAVKKFAEQSPIPVALPQTASPTDKWKDSPPHSPAYAPKHP